MSSIDLIAIYTGFQLGLSAVQSVLNAIAGLYEDNLFLSHFYAFLALQPTVNAPSDPQPLPAHDRQRIEIRSVSFSYPNKDNTVLNHVNLSLQPGQVIALVGENGSGKTTLIKLLCQLYRPDKGQITLGGVDIAEFDPVDWRQSISVIFQDYVHYYLTAGENIWLGNVAVVPDIESIVTASRKSGADTFIQTLPDRYETNLGTMFGKGQELSGGEWQKIALARLFYRDARIIVLDEPTSSLDPLAEAELFQKFREIIRGKSAILISHRFSTVQMADYIYVMDSGRIIEHGTHDQLFSSGGKYSALYTAQAEHFHDREG